MDGQGAEVVVGPWIVVSSQLSVFNNELFAVIYHLRRTAQA